MSNEPKAKTLSVAVQGDLRLAALEADKSSKTVSKAYGHLRKAAERLITEGYTCDSFQDESFKDSIKNALISSLPAKAQELLAWDLETAKKEVIAKLHDPDGHVWRDWVALNPHVAPSTLRRTIVTAHRYMLTREALCPDEGRHEALRSFVNMACGRINAHMRKLTTSIDATVTTEEQEALKAKEADKPEDKPEADKGESDKGESDKGEAGESDKGEAGESDKGEAGESDKGEADQGEAGESDKGEPNEPGEKAGKIDRVEVRSPNERLLDALSAIEEAIEGIQASKLPQGVTDDLSVILWRVVSCTKANDIKTLAAIAKTARFVK